MTALGSVDKVYLQTTTIVFHLKIGHEGSAREYRYKSTLSLTSALHGVGGQRHAPATLPPIKTRYPLCTRLGGPQDWSGE